MKLITELNEDVEIISEDVGGKKNLYITGIYMQAGIKNRNGRLYPQGVLENEVNRYITEKVSKNRAHGELNHPQSPVVNLERASHRIVELKQDGKNFLGKSLVLDTPMGNIVRGLLEGGSSIGVSSRGMGTLKKSGMVVEVQADFRLATAADVVSDPSAPDAFVDGIMEGVEWVCDPILGWQAVDLVEQVRAASHKKVLTESQKLRAFQLFIERVKNVDVRQIDELSRATVASYMTKAQRDLGDSRRKTKGMSDEEWDSKVPESEKRRQYKRYRGLDDADYKLNRPNSPLNRVPAK